LLESGGDRATATGQRSDHDPVSCVQFVDDNTRDVPQLAGHAMALHRRTDRLGDDQSDLRHARTVVRRVQRMDD